MSTLANCAGEALFQSFFKSSEKRMQNLCKGLEKSMCSGESSEKHSSLILLSSLSTNKTLRRRLCESVSLVESLMNVICHQGTLMRAYCT